MTYTIRHVPEHVSSHSKLFVPEYWCVMRGNRRVTVGFETEGQAARALSVLLADDQRMLRASRGGLRMVG